MPDQNLFLAPLLQTVGVVPVGVGEVPLRAERVAALHQEMAQELELLETVAVLVEESRGRLVNPDLLLDFLLIAAPPAELELLLADLILVLNPAVAAVVTAHTEEAETVATLPQEMGLPEVGMALAVAVVVAMLVRQGATAALELAASLLLRSIWKDEQVRTN
jgi:hypothetical protein